MMKTMEQTIEIGLQRRSTELDLWNYGWVNGQGRESKQVFQFDVDFL